MHVGYPYIALAHDQMSAVVAFQCDGLLFCILNFGPGLDDVNSCVCFIEKTNGYGLQLVVHRKDMNRCCIISFHLVAVNRQLKVEVAVGVQYLQCRQHDHIDCSKCRQGRRIEVGTCIAQLLHGGCPCSIIGHTQVASLAGMNDEHRARGLDGYIAAPCRDAQCAYEWQQK